MGKIEVKSKRKRKEAKIKVVLPEEYTEPAANFNDYALLIHGEKKIGKTSLSLQGPGNVLLLECDPPQLAYRRKELQLPNWATFLAILERLEQEAGSDTPFPFDRVVLDGADIWYQRCLEYVCKQRVITHPEDEAYGKGWHGVRKEFTQAVDRLLRLPCGTWFLCHSSWKEVKLRKGGKVDKLLPRLSGQAEEILNGKVDGWFAYDYDGDNRILILQGDDMTGAGHRLDSSDAPHFRNPDKKPLRSIRMGTTASKAYENLEAAYNNMYIPPKKPESKHRVKKGGKTRKQFLKKK